jgi:potassium efflux system protein
MTVGLGFGLQEIFANFVSGLMLLFERPIRIGDTVTIGEISGVVSRIRIRATTITDWDRKELVIPNKEFITGKVINWTLSDSTLRIIIPVGIAYQSDTELAEQLLYKVARAHENVLSDPPPRVYFMGFGDSALQFELRVFVASVDLSMSTRHDLNKAIDHEFRQAGIEIALPQRDIHVRTIQQPLALLHPEHHDYGKLRGGLSLGEAAPEQQRDLDGILRTATPKSRDESR